MWKGRTQTGLALSALGAGMVLGFAPTHQRMHRRQRRGLRPVDMMPHDMHDAIASAQHLQHAVVEPLASRIQDAVVHSPLASKAHDAMIQAAQIAGGHHRGSSSSKLLESYGGLLRSHPLPTKAATAACLAAAGDAVAQTKATATGSSDERKYDLTRGTSFALFAAAYTGAFQHFWFSWLNANLAFTAASLSPTLAVLFASPSSPSLLAATKVCLNQFLVVPAVYMPLFFAVTGAMAGLTLEEGAARARDLYLPILARNWAFWLPAQFVQFSFVAPEWQVPYLCAAGLLWTVILSSVGGTSTSSSAANASQGADAGAPALDVTDTVTLMDVGDAIVDATTDAADAIIDGGAAMIDVVEGAATDAASFVAETITESAEP